MGGRSSLVKPTHDGGRMIVGLQFTSKAQTFQLLSVNDIKGGMIKKRPFIE
jgi:hypothetical protein